MNRRKRKSDTLQSLNRLRQLQEEQARLAASRARAEHVRAEAALDEETARERRLIGGVAERRAGQEFLALDRYQQELEMLVAARERVEQRRVESAETHARRSDCVDAYADSWRRRRAAEERLARVRTEQRRELDKRRTDAVTEIWLGRRGKDD